MAFNPSSPLTGLAITGLTSPTFTFVSDIGPSINSKQFAVTSLGGTQTGVVAHSPDVPFTFTQKRPPVLKTLGAKNAVTGMYLAVPSNEYATLIRKGIPVQAGQYGIMLIDIRVRVPAGAGSFDPTSVKSTMSLAGGLVSNQIQGMVDMILQGVM